MRPGDLVQVIIASIPISLQYGAERMWCTVDRIDGEDVYGSLDNEPFDIPQLTYGEKVRFKIWHIIDYQYLEGDVKDPHRDAHLPEMEEKQIWDRCMVDSCVVDESVPVEYIYKEEPDLGSEDDKFPDSGWRIRGDARGVSDSALESREAKYIAIGVVLNKDDSWLHLLDAPVGCSFMRNFDTGEYEECE